MAKDYFVVVQTIEAGKPVLTVVPHKWVNGNTLLCPPKQANELRKNAASLPMSSWSKMSCSVQRKYIPTFADAEQEADELSGQSTDASDFAPRRKKKFKKPAFNKEIDLNHLVTGEAQITSVSPPAVPVTSQPVPVTSQPVENIYYEPELNELLVNSQGIALDFPSTVAAQIPTTPTILVETMLLGGYVVNIEQPDADRIIKQISDKIEMVAEKVVDEVTVTVLNSLEKMLAKTAAKIEMQIDTAIRQKMYDPYSEASSLE